MSEISSSSTAAPLLVRLLLLGFLVDGAPLPLESFGRAEGEGRSVLHTSGSRRGGGWWISSSPLSSPFSLETTGLDDGSVRFSRRFSKEDFNLYHQEARDRSSGVTTGD